MGRVGINAAVGSNGTPAAESTEQGTSQSAPDPEGEQENAPYLVAQNLSARGPEGLIFTDLWLTAHRGETVALIGNAGTGRTSALLALTGRFGCETGTLQLADHTKASQIRQLSTIAMAPPGVDLEPNHTIGQLIDETAIVARTTHKQVRATCAALDVHADSATRFSQLPKVDQIAFALAFAAAHRRPVIACDNVDAGLDTEGIARVWTVVRALAEQNHLLLATAVNADLGADQLIRMRCIDEADRSATQNPTRVFERE